MNIVVQIWIFLMISYDELLARYVNNTTPMRKKTTTIPKVLGPLQLQIPYQEAGRRNLLEAAAKLLGAFKKSKHKLKETVYEPYWVGGEWVFFRTTPQLYKWQTPRKTTTTPWSSTTSTTTRYSTSRTTPYLNYACQHPCPRLFEEYGQICGQRFDGFKYEMKQFDDACDLYSENCINPFIKKRWEWYRGPWYILFRGPCWNMTTQFRWVITDFRILVNNSDMLHSKVLYNIEHSVFVPVTNKGGHQAMMTMGDKDERLVDFEKQKEEDQEKNAKKKMG